MRLKSFFNSGLAVLSLASSALATEPAVRWENWSDGAFARAQAERRLVLLDLGAVWCHWCHVMEETTYEDPKVTELLREHFVAIRVDQDSRPDLSNRYEDYGWPATVVFDAKGNELVKFAGYIPPPRMAALLQAVVEDPTPGPSIRPLTPTPLPSPPTPKTPASGRCCLRPGICHGGPLPEGEGRTEAPSSRRRCARTFAHSSLTVVGPRQDPRARALLAAALSEPSLYKRVELWDRREGPLPNLDVEFPDLERPAAFVCSNGRCSLPAFQPKDLLARAARLNTLAAVSP